MSDESFKDRVVAEKHALDGNIHKLRVFIDTSHIFPTLPDNERVRLHLQLNLMRQYSDVLGSRIRNDFK